MACFHTVSLKTNVTPAISSTIEQCRKALEPATSIVEKDIYPKVVKEVYEKIGRIINTNA